MRDFRKLEVWKDAVQLCTSIYSLSDNLPKEEKFGLQSQIRRSAVSIPSNIAEGCSRRTSKDFARFLDIALGSSFELETQLIISIELAFLEKKSTIKLKEQLTILQKRINALRTSILT